MSTFGNGQSNIKKGNQVIATGHLDVSLYVVQTKRLSQTHESAFVASLQLWHERMAHVDKRGIAQMVHRKSTDMICDGCAQGKAQRSDIPKVRTSDRSSMLLGRVHSDVCGPVEVPSLGGSRYFVTFIDECSNWMTIYLLKQKSEVAECFLEYEKYAERQTGNKIRILRSDRGGEYLSKSLTTYFKHQGIVHELTAAYTPHQNGVAERANRTLLNLVRSMMHHMKTTKSLWAEALSTAVYARNRMTSRALPSNLTPFHT